MNQLTQEQFEHVLDLLVLYKQLNPKENVYLNEKCIKKSLTFMNNIGSKFASQLGMNNGDSELSSSLLEHMDSVIKK